MIVLLVVKVYVLKEMGLLNVREVLLINEVIVDKFDMVDVI